MCFNKIRSNVSLIIPAKPAITSGKAYQSISFAKVLSKLIRRWRKCLYKRIGLTNEANKLANKINNTPSSGRAGSNNPIINTKFKIMFTPMELNCIPANLNALFSALSFANGKAVTASIHTIAPNKIMYSLCSEYNIKSAMF